MVLQRLAIRSRQIYNSTQLFNTVKLINNNLTYTHFSVSASRLADRRYTDKHEWVEINGKIGTVGISHYAQEALGDVVFAQLPDVGTVLKPKDECGALESVKAASELYSPVSGAVTEKNESVEKTPGLINSSCYDKGWLFKLELANAKEIETLMNEKQYEEFLKSEEQH